VVLTAGVSGVDGADMVDGVDRGLTELMALGRLRCDSIVRGGWFGVVAHGPLIFKAVLIGEKFPDHKFYQSYDIIKFDPWSK